MEPLCFELDFATARRDSGLGRREVRTWRGSKIPGQCKRGQRGDRRLVKPWKMRDSVAAAQRGGWNRGQGEMAGGSLGCLFKVPVDLMRLTGERG